MNMWKRLLSESGPSSFVSDASQQRQVIQSAVSVAEPTPMSVSHAKPRPVPVTAPTLPDDYEAVAERIGAGHLLRGVKEARESDARAAKRESARVAIVNALAELGLRTYDESAVAAYLKTVYGATPFGWRALRDKDNPLCERMWRAGSYVDHNGRWVDTWSECGAVGFGGFGKGAMRVIGGKDVALYAKPVPLPVLLTIEAIQQRVPDALFFVSDEARRMPERVDPFLMVLVAGERYIVERWDEPSFRG